MVVKFCYADKKKYATFNLRFKFKIYCSFVQPRGNPTIHSMYSGLG